MTELIAAVNLLRNFTYKSSDVKVECYNKCAFVYAGKGTNLLKCPARRKLRKC